MAKAKTTGKKYKVTAKVPNYSGIGAGGIHFAYGCAIIDEGWVLDWYRERGYAVEELPDETPTQTPAP